jgi:predicted RNA-binding Zn ribbon-like protein
VRSLTERAARRTREAATVFTRALELREAVYRIFAALAVGRAAAQADLAVLNETLGRASSNARVTPGASAFQWTWDLEDTAIDLPLCLIALSAAGLLTSDDCRRVRQCADEDGCGWLFVDTSRNHSRRWCDINDCGNRAKQRRYQQRVRKS